MSSIEEQIYKAFTRLSPYEQNVIAALPSLLDKWSRVYALATPRQIPCPRPPPSNPLTPAAPSSSTSAVSSAGPPAVINVFGGTVHVAVGAVAPEAAQQEAERGGKTTAKTSGKGGGRGTSRGKGLHPREPKRQQGQARSAASSGGSSRGSGRQEGEEQGSRTASTVDIGPPLPHSPSESRSNVAASEEPAQRAPRPPSNTPQSSQSGSTALPVTPYDQSPPLASEGASVDLVREEGQIDPWLVRDMVAGGRYGPYIALYDMTFKTGCRGVRVTFPTIAMALQAGGAMLSADEVEAGWYVVVSSRTDEVIQQWQKSARPAAKDVSRAGPPPRLHDTISTLNGTIYSAVDFPHAWAGQAYLEIGSREDDFAPSQTIALLTATFNADDEAELATRRNDSGFLTTLVRFGSEGRAVRVREDVMQFEGGRWGRYEIWARVWRGGERRVQRTEGKEDGEVGGRFTVPEPSAPLGVEQGRPTTPPPPPRPPRPPRPPSSGNANRPAPFPCPPSPPPETGEGTVLVSSKDSEAVTIERVIDGLKLLPIEGLGRLHLKANERRDSVIVTSFLDWRQATSVAEGLVREVQGWETMLFDALVEPVAVYRCKSETVQCDLLASSPSSPRQGLAKSPSPRLGEMQQDELGQDETEQAGEDGENAVTARRQFYSTKGNSNRPSRTPFSPISTSRSAQILPQVSPSAIVKRLASRRASNSGVPNSPSMPLPPAMPMTQSGGRSLRTHLPAPTSNASGRTARPGKRGPAEEEVDLEMDERAGKKGWSGRDNVGLSEERFDEIWSDNVNEGGQSSGCWKVEVVEAVKQAAGFPFMPNAVTFSRLVLDKLFKQDPGKAMRVLIIEFLDALMYRCDTVKLVFTTKTLIGFAIAAVDFRTNSGDTRLPSVVALTSPAATKRITTDIESIAVSDKQSRSPVLVSSGKHVRLKGTLGETASGKSWTVDLDQWRARRQDLQEQPKDSWSRALRKAAEVEEEMEEEREEDSVEDEAESEE